MSVSPRQERVNIVHGTYPELIAFLVLNVWASHFGLPILLAIVIFSKRIHRHPTFLNLCFAFILIGISSSLLLYTGHITGPEPPPMLCLLQASLLYGMPALSSTAVFALVYQMFVAIRASYHGRTTKQHNFIQTWLLLALPYIAWIACILATAFIGAQNPDKVSRNRRFFYCSVENLTLTNTLTVVAAAIVFATLVLEAWTLFLFYKVWKSIRSGQGKRTFELNMPIRILSFGLYLMLALSSSLLSIKSPASPAPDLIIASAASVVVIIFGTQRDILRVSAFWKKERPSMPERYIGRPILQE